MDWDLPGSSIRGILQARILEWVPISFFRDLPDPGIKPESPALLADSLPSEPQGEPKWRKVEGKEQLAASPFYPKINSKGLIKCQK